MTTLQQELLKPTFRKCQARNTLVTLCAIRSLSCAAKTCREYTPAPVLYQFLGVLAIQNFNPVTIWVLHTHDASNVKAEMPSEMQPECFILAPTQYLDEGKPLHSSCIWLLDKLHPKLFKPFTCLVHVRHMKAAFRQQVVGSSS